jgi:membrane protein DedA with SNARE-associated domain
MCLLLPFVKKKCKWMFETFPHMSTQSQRSFFLRFRFRLLVGYVLLLGLSWMFTALRSPPLHSKLQASGDSGAADFLILSDPLHESAAALKILAAHLRDQGYRVQQPGIPGINQVIRESGGFKDIADRLSLPTPAPILIANGQAGAVALHMAARSADSVEALVLVDASGVQEFILMGEYHLNYALYALSDMALSVFNRLVPHFGLFTDLELTRSQLNVLRYSDRRTLRPLIDTITQPVLIIQYADRENENFQAREHARLLPQSHFITLQAPVPLDPSLRDFMEALRSGEAVTRPGAPAHRLEDSQAAFDSSHRPWAEGGALILLLSVIALATLVTEDITCAITGLMIANGNLSWVQGVGACLSGILFGDYLLFWAGHRWGRPALNRIPLRWMIDPMALRETEEWFSRHAEKAIFISRFVPGTRLPAYVAAGILGVPVKRFTAWFVLAGVIWTPLFVSLSVLLAEQALDWIDRFHHTAPALLVSGVAVYLLLTQILLPSFNWRGRRKLLGKWKRFIRPEYWPASILYAPILAYLCGRCFRKGNRFLDFTACNPCIPGSGIVEESKTAILDRIQDRNAIAPYRAIPTDLSLEDRIRVMDQFIQERNLTFPVVLKPDTGQRGHQVLIADDREQLTAMLRSKPDITWILQSYISGSEFGIFYIRDPRQETGFIFGITRKAFPQVIGDGTRLLEDLILAHERGVCQYRMFARAFAEQLYDIPEEGARISLTQVGNHARGTQFLEGRDLITPKLEACIEHIAQSIPGYYFGRFDIRCPSEEDLRLGENISLIELNGLTSESTNLYDSRYHYREMVWILLKQWQWACHVGRINRLRGQALYPFTTILKDYDQFRKKHIAALKSGSP